jgi:hypothetical protein
VPEEAAIPVPTLAIIPLDDRPCNRLFPGQLAAAGGLHVVMPPREALGWFTRPGDYESIAAWLGDVDSEHFVISVDMLCFGGLVASRAPDAPLAEALNRLEALRALRTSRPNATVFAFSTIMRLGKTVAQSGDLDGHTLLRSYSELLDRAERLGDHDASTELAAIERKLTPEVLSDYLEARRRNHAINRAAIRLAADGVIDYLALSQEDAAPIGIHIPEQLALRAQIEEFRAGDRASISQGADEVGLLLLARHCLLANNTSVGIAPDYAAEQGAEVYPAFESQPLRKTLETAISIAGARAVPPMEADAMLFVHTPVETQPDIAQATPCPRSPILSLQAEGLAERVEMAAQAGRVFGLADVAYCNGADPELICALQSRKLLGKLQAFAGWNTAANTVGTVVAHLCLLAAADPARGHAATGGGWQFVASRLIDDYGYQSAVRPRAMERARQMGADPFSLGESCGQMESYVAEELRPLARDLLASFPLTPELDDEPDVRFSLPWHRLFEVEVDLCRSALEPETWQG